MPKMHFLLSSILRFPPKEAKCVVSARESRQQIGLKATWHYISLYFWNTLLVYDAPMPPAFFGDPSLRATQLPAWFQARARSKLPGRQEAADLPWQLWPSEQSTTLCVTVCLWPPPLSMGFLGQGTLISFQILSSSR